jgi:hypothetical protein
MRIKKKAPKPSSKRPPLYFIGYRGAVPQPDELQAWYDLAYGGPLTIKQENGAPESWHARHGPWSAHVVIPVPATHTSGLNEQLAWEHESIGAVSPSLMPPRDMPDAVLFSARLARGLTLLTQGTSYDVTTGAYMNPSDWQDRPLSVFSTTDHVTMVEAETDDARQWLHTLGLKKFGLDEVELFRASGLSTDIQKEQLAQIADGLTREGQSPKVGSIFQIEDLSVKILNHRTASSAGSQLILREVEVRKV